MKKKRTTTKGGNSKSSLDELAREVYLDLFRTHEALAYSFKTLLAGHGLSEPQYNALRILRGAGEALQVLQVRKRMLTRDSDMTRLFDRLVRRDLVRRSRCDQDRRVVWVELTPTGKELLRTLDRPVMKLHREQLAGLGPAKLRSLKRLLAEALEAAS